MMHLISILFHDQELLLLYTVYLYFGGVIVTFGQLLPPCGLCRANSGQHLQEAVFTFLMLKPVFKHSQISIHGIESYDMQGKHLLFLLAMLATSSCWLLEKKLNLELALPNILLKHSTNCTVNVVN